MTDDKPWRARRMTGAKHNVLARLYGPFRHRDEAAWVGQRASEKHRGDLVVVEPTAPQLELRREGEEG